MYTFLRMYISTRKDIPNISEYSVYTHLVVSNVDWCPKPSSLPQDFRVPLAIATIAPCRLLRLSRLLTLSKTPRETLTPATWQHVNYLMDGGIMEEFTCETLNKWIDWKYVTTKIEYWFKLVYIIISLLKVANFRGHPGIVYYQTHPNHLVSWWYLLSLIEPVLDLEIVNQRPLNMNMFQVCLVKSPVFQSIESPSNHHAMALNHH